MTAVNSQKQLISHIKALLRTLSQSHPDYNAWEQNLHDAEYELDAKKWDHRDAINKVGVKRMALRLAEDAKDRSARRLRRAKELRDGELGFLTRLEARKVTLLDKKAQLIKDMAAARANTQRVRDEDEDEENGDDNQDP